MSTPTEAMLKELLLAADKVVAANARTYDDVAPSVAGQIYALQVTANKIRESLATADAITQKTLTPAKRVEEGGGGK